MIKLRHILIISLAVFFLTAGLAFAESDDANLTSGEVESHDFSHLNEAIANVSDGGEISLEDKYEYNGTWIADIDKSVTLKGSANRTTIDLKKASTDFNIISANVSFDRVDFENSKGYTIRIKDSSISLTDCSFKNCGSIIYSEGGNITLINCSFAGGTKIIDSFGYEHVDSLTIENCRFSNIDRGVFLLNVSDAVVKDSSFLNFSEWAFQIHTDSMTFTNCTFDSVTSYGVYGSSNKASFKSNRFRNSKTGIYLERAPVFDWDANSFANIEKPFSIPMGSLKLTSSEFINISEVMEFDFSQIDILGSRFDNVSVKFLQAVSAVISDSRFDNCRIMGHSDKANTLSVKNSKFANGTVSEFYGSLSISNSSFADCASFEHWHGKLNIIDSDFINTGFFDQSEGNINITNSNFIGICGDEMFTNIKSDSITVDKSSFINASCGEWLLSYSAKKISVTNSYFINNANGGLELFSKDCALDLNVFADNICDTIIYDYIMGEYYKSTSLTMTNNVIARNHDKNGRDSCIMLSPAYDGNGDIVSEMNTKNNFYGFNMYDAYEFKNINVIYPFYLDESWVNIEFAKISDTRYRLSFTGNGAKTAKLGDYRVSVKNRTGGIIKSDVLIHNGIGEFDCNASLTLEDIWILNSADKIVNKPKAKISITQSGDSYENIMFTVKVCDEAGNPIKNEEVGIFHREGSLKSYYLDKTNSKGEVYIKTGWFKGHVANSYSIQPFFSDTRYSYTTTPEYAFTVKKAEAVITASKLKYDYGGKITVQVKSKATGKSIGDFTGVLKVYSKSKLVKKVSFTTLSGGKAKFKSSLNLNAGTYSAEIISDSSIYEANTVKFKITVNKIKTTVKAPKITVKFKKSKYFKATVKSKTSKKPVKNVKVKIKVAGKTFTVRTDKKGIAKINTKKIKKGKHTVKISSANKNYSVSAKSKITIR